MIHVTIHPIDAPRCSLCKQAQEYGVTFRGPTVTSGDQEIGYTSITLCKSCLDEVGRTYQDELLREGHVEVLGTMLDQLVVRLHRQN